MSSRRRFWNYMLLILALAALAFAGFRLFNTAQDHKAPAAAEAG